MNAKLLISGFGLCLAECNTAADTPNNFKYLMQQTWNIISTARSTWHEVKQSVPIYHIVFEDPDGQRATLIKKHGLLTLQQQANNHLIAYQPFDHYWPLTTTRIFFSPNHEFHEHNEKYSNKLSQQKYTVVATLVNPETTKVHADIFMAAFNLTRYEKTGSLYREWEKNEQKYKHMQKHVDKEHFEIVRNVEQAGEPVLVPKNSHYSYPYRQKHTVEISLPCAVKPKYLSIFTLIKNQDSEKSEQQKAQIKKTIWLLRLRTWGYKTLERLNTTHRLN